VPSGPAGLFDLVPQLQLQFEPELGEVENTWMSRLNDGQHLATHPDQVIGLGDYLLDETSDSIILLVRQKKAGNESIVEVERASVLAITRLAQAP
jgi:hypothetical protein